MRRKGIDLTHAVMPEWFPQNGHRQSLQLDIRIAYDVWCLLKQELTHRQEGERRHSAA